MKKILIIGCGLSGAVIAREFANKNFKVDIIEKRHHIAGNCYDFLNEKNILVHKYGPHLFHTSNDVCISWLSEFTDWIEYKHKVKAQLSDGRLVTLPVNKETAEIVGKNNIIKTFFEPYTKKMWGLSITELSPDILQRVPVRDDLNEYYFPNDSFQAMPKNGYTKLFENILRHENISIKLNCPYSISAEKGYDLVFNSMPIDEYYDFCFDKLPYRSIKFHNYTVPVPHLFPVVTVNFTNDSPFTRVTEWKNIPNSPETVDNKFYTTITIEEPCSYEQNNMERYYPVKDLSGSNQELYQKYASLKQPNMFFIGRCGCYKYMDMDDAFAESYQLCKALLS